MNKDGLIPTIAKSTLQILRTCLYRIGSPLPIKIAWNAVIENCSLQKKCKIGQHATIIRSTLLCNARVYERVRLVGSTLGRHSYIAERAHINQATIGNFTCIGPEVLIGLASHPISEFVSVHPIFYSRHFHTATPFVQDSLEFKEMAETYIGNDVWLGARCIIKGGINIGDGAIVGAGSVVTKDVPPYAIVVGAPARIIRHRYTKEIIDKLLKLAWWNYPDSWLRQNCHKFSSTASILEACELERNTNAQ